MFGLFTRGDGEVNQLTKEELEQIQFILQQWNSQVEVLDKELFEKVQDMINECDDSLGMKR